MNVHYLSFQKLSLRERQIATLMSEGYSADELGHTLHLNQSKLSIIKTKMMSKLSFNTVNDFNLFLNWVKKYID